MMSWLLRHHQARMTPYSKSFIIRTSYFIVLMISIAFCSKTIDWWAIFKKSSTENYYYCYDLLHRFNANFAQRRLINDFSNNSIWLSHNVNLKIVKQNLSVFSSLDACIRRTVYWYYTKYDVLIRMHISY